MDEQNPLGTVGNKFSLRNLAVNLIYLIYTQSSDNGLMLAPPCKTSNTYFERK